MAQTLKPEKRTAILKAAKARFRKYGVKETTMNQIADDAGLAVGNLYRYFANKTEIVAACAEEFTQKHRDVVRDLATSDLDWYSKLEKYVLMRFAASQEVRLGTGFASEIARAVIDAKPDRLIDESNLFMGFVVSALREGKSAGRLGKCKDIEREAKVFGYAMSFFFPVSGNVVIVEPTESELLKTLEWFKRKWLSD